MMDTARATSSETQLQTLKSTELLMQYPTVKAAVNKGTDLYKRMKHSNVVLKWYFGFVEKSACVLSTVASPLVKKFDSGIKVLDDAVSKRILAVEKAAPVVKESPEKIYEAAKQYSLDAVVTVYNRVRPLVDPIVRKLGTVTERLFIALDALAETVEQLLDGFLPDFSSSNSSLSARSTPSDWDGRMCDPSQTPPSGHSTPRSASPGSLGATRRLSSRLACYAVSMLKLLTGRKPAAS